MLGRGGAFTDLLLQLRHRVIAAEIRVLYKGMVDFIRQVQRPEGVIRGKDRAVLDQGFVYPSIRSRQKGRGITFIVLAGHTDNSLSAQPGNPGSNL